MIFESKTFRNLVLELRKLPGIGPRSARRIASHLVKVSVDEAKSLCEAVHEARASLTFCSVCCNLSDKDPCQICTDDRRDREIVCVVESPADTAPIESSQSYRGLYHVLHGALSPLEDRGPGDLRIAELMNRLKKEEIREVILATNPSVEGEATASHLSELIKPLGIRVTRIARGIPMGSELRLTDELTLSRALEERREI